MDLKMNSAIGKQILSLVRNGNYAHPGEEEAIDLVFRKISKEEKRKILDVGCGLFGTANYLQNCGYGKVTGIDLNENVLNLAMERYPDADIHQCDVYEADKILKNKFELIYLFNSFYSFPDHLKALSVLKKVAANNCELIIFDYADPGNYNSEDVEIPNPVKLHEAENTFKNAGWKIQEIEDITDLYIKWYSELCDKITSMKNEIINISNIDMYNYVEYQYRKMLKLCSAGEMKGVIISAMLLN